jgi:hypothetical protein
VQFGGELPPAYAQRRGLLAQGGEAVIAVLTGGDEDAIRRRSSSPFAGVLTPAERWEILTVSRWKPRDCRAAGGTGGCRSKTPTPTATLGFVSKFTTQ